MEIQFEEPNILYKYRNWSNCYHKKLITDLELYFAQPLSFNDPFDFQLSLRYDLLTRDQRLVHYRNEYIKKGYIDEYLEFKANYQVDHGPLTDPEHLERNRKYTIEKMNSSFGVVSLSKVPDSILMWSHYANCHTGFCVGLNTKFFWDELGVKAYKVSYSDKYPEIIPVEENNLEHYFDVMMTTKFKDWEYEQEFRFIKSGYSEKAKKLTGKYYESLILGCAMPEIQRKEILEMQKKYLPNIKVYLTEKHKTDFKIILYQIK